MRQKSKEMRVDLDDMLLITAYKPPCAHIDTGGFMTVHEELNLGFSVHSDYVSTVGPFNQMLLQIG
jgi:hypothetical protein